MHKRNLKIAISIDGGGIRGLIPLIILHHLNERFATFGKGYKTVDFIDFVSGTSTGAIISACIVAKKEGIHLFTVEDLLNLYKSRGAQLFNLAQPENSQSEGLRLLLKRQLKGIKLGDLSTDFSLVSFDKLTNKPFLFESRDESLSELPLSMALTACSAIPGYFAPVEYKGRQLIDGIMFAKNPAEITYQSLKKMYPDDEVLLISLGTGVLSNENYDDMEIEADRVDAYLQDQAAVNNQLSYYRFQPKIKTASEMMDDASIHNIQALIDDANTYITLNKEVFDELVDRIKNSID